MKRSSCSVFILFSIFTVHFMFMNTVYSVERYDYKVGFTRLTIEEDNEYTSDEEYAVYVGFRFQFGIHGSLQVFPQPVVRGHFEPTAITFSNFLSPHSTKIFPTPEFLGVFILFMEEDYSRGLEMANALRDVIVEVTYRHFEALTDANILLLSEDEQKEKFKEIEENIETDLDRDLTSTYRRIKAWWRDEDDIVGLALVFYTSYMNSDKDVVPDDTDNPEAPLSIEYKRDIEGKYRLSGLIYIPYPVLAFPENKAVLDNGCQDRSNPKEWQFDWCDWLGATQYNIYVIGQDATSPVINEVVTTSSYQWSNNGYIINENRFNWTWKVRALSPRVGNWSPWSKERKFDVEPLDTDCR